VSDLHSINEAINARAGRKLLPSIAVGLSLVALIWVSLAVERTAFALVLSLALVLATKELSEALNSVGFVNSFRTLAVAVVTISLSTWFAGINGLVIATATSFTAIVLLSLRHGTENFVKRASSTALALTYLPLLGGFIMLIARPSNGLAAVMTFLLIIGCNDTFGYIVGVLIGKHPLAPTISPKKSYEGLFGSLVGTMVGGGLTFHYILESDYRYGVVTGLVIVFTATSGDLIESAMKRDMSLKDMGNILPGHGGMLDRLDSAIFSAPAFYLALEVVKRLS
jgi:phosphatidate cytidylyltransferase